MSSFEEAADAMLAALDTWQDVDWAEVRQIVEEASHSPEWLGGNGQYLLLWERIIAAARDILASMQEQSIRPSVLPILEEIEKSPIELHGLDGRRVGVTRLGGDRLRRHLDAEMLRVLSRAFQGRSEQDLERYQLVFVAALDHHSQLMPIAHEYLWRAARLLLLGLDEECVVFCRAALEAALKQRLDDEEMMARGFKKRRSKNGVLYDYDLHTRIKAARSSEALFSQDLYERAMALKDDGNRAVHPDVLETYATRPLDAMGAFRTLTLAVRKLLIAETPKL